MNSSSILQQGSAMTYTEGFISSLCHLFRVIEVSVTLLLCELRSPPHLTVLRSEVGCLSDCMLYLYHILYIHYMGDNVRTYCLMFDINNTYITTIVWQAVLFSS